MEYRVQLPTPVSVFDKERKFAMHLDRHHPKDFMDWAKKDKMIIGFYDKFHMRPEIVNLSEVFDQMNSSQKIFALRSMFNKLLSPDERSFFITEITNPETVEAPIEERDSDEEPEHDWS